MTFGSGELNLNVKFISQDFKILIYFDKIHM